MYHIEQKNIYEHLKIVSQRPQMYIGDRSIHKLETYINGYQTALLIHDIKEEGCPNFQFFYNWLAHEYGINPVGGCRGILEVCKNEEEALQMFFSYVKEYSHLTVEHGQVFKLSKGQKWSAEFIEANPGFKNVPVPNRLQVVHLRPGNSCYVEYWHFDNQIHVGSLHQDLESAFYTVNWTLGLKLKAKS